MPSSCLRKCWEQQDRLLECTINVCNCLRKTTPENEYPKILPLDNRSANMVANRRSEIFRPQPFLIVNHSPERIIEIALFSSAKGPSNFLNTLLKGHSTCRIVAVCGSVRHPIENVQPFSFGSFLHCIPSCQNAWTLISQTGLWHTNSLVPISVVLPCQRRRALCLNIK